MRRDVPAVRIFPMSDKIEGFRGRTIEAVQRDVFLKRLPAMKGRYRYRSSGLNADPGTVVLFQFKARIIASATFLRDEKFEKPKGGCKGAMYFEIESFRTFEPLDALAMKKVWPGFRAFGHVKQALNPTLLSKFKRRLKNVEEPLIRVDAKVKALKKPRKTNDELQKDERNPEANYAADRLGITDPEFISDY